MGLWPSHPLPVASDLSSCSHDSWVPDPLLYLMADACPTYWVTTYVAMEAQYVSDTFTQISFRWFPRHISIPRKRILWIFHQSFSIGAISPTTSMFLRHRCDSPCNLLDIEGNDVSLFKIRLSSSGIPWSTFLIHGCATSCQKVMRWKLGVHFAFRMSSSAYPSSSPEVLSQNFYISLSRNTSAKEP